MDRDERFRLRVAQFDLAYRRFEEALAQPETEFIRDATIQRFEFTYELAWKAMRAWLLVEGVDVSTPKETLRASVTYKLIEDANAWSKLQEFRNLTSHTYHQETAKKVYDFLKQEGLQLFRGLTLAFHAKQRHLEERGG